MQLSGLADDATELLRGGDASHLSEQRIDLLSDLGAGVSINAGPMGRDVYTIASVA